MTTNAAEPVLEARNIVKVFPGVRALGGVGLRVHRGRLLALLGENGAGKSTLMNVLAGALKPDEGELVLAGQAVRFINTRAAQAAGIGIVFQELNLIPHLTVAENIFLGREPRTLLGLIDYRRLNQEAAAILHRLALEVDPSAIVADLRVGQRQLVEIARAISENARILILDEPTSSLSSHEVEVLFGVVKDLKRQGVAMIYSTHKFEELAPICDDIVIMRDGQIVGQGPLKDFDRDAIVRLMAGRKPQETFKRSEPRLGPELLRAEEICFRASEAPGRTLVDKLSLSVRCGEIVGLFGLIGAGRTELLEVLFGLHPKRATGALLIAGSPWRPKSPAAAIAAGIALVPEDRKREGLVLSMSVAANASLASLRRTMRAGLLDESRERAHVLPLLERFHVRFASLHEPIRNLSGGNQQKVILAKWLATGPKLLLLDEPTRGIDVNAKREIYAFIDELAQSGLGIIVVSSELPEVLALADRVIVMCEGRKTADLTRGEATPERVLAAALPHEP